MNTKFTEDFKEQAVQKALLRGTTHLKTVAKELEIGYSTLQKWIRDYRAVTPDIEKNQRPQDWSRKEQLQALMDTVAMSEEQNSQYCREKGIFPHHLDKWQSDFQQEKNEAKKSKPAQAEIKILKEKIAELEKEIRRKDKALAETAALLVLQKKFRALLEEKE
ncbi:MAG: transposase [Thiomicrorhabdus sp.]|nr:transposase [Thiomicrorhabdus sp.]